MKGYFFLVLILCACSQPQSTQIISMESPAQTGSAEPFLFTDEAGQVYLSWVERHDTLSQLKYARLENDQWTTRLITSGKSWFVNWADYPMLAVNHGQYVAHYLQKSGEGTFAYDIKLVTSADGETWTTPFIIHDDGKQAEHGFVSLLPYGDNFLVTWLDGRNTVMEGETMDYHEGHHGVMTLRAAIINPAGTKLSEWELDDRTCDCCQTTAVLTSQGPAVIYRDRSDTEIRDISIVRWINGVWTKPKSIYPDEWVIAGCPVNGPRADAINHTLAIAWFTASENQPAVKVIFSKDAGETFGNPIRMDAGKTIGRVDLVLQNEDTAFVSWMEGSSIMAMRVTADGSKGKPVVVATSSEQRSSGFPQLTLQEDRLIFAWTNDSTKTIRTAYLSLESL